VYSQEMTPHPARTLSAPPSPATGEGKETSDSLLKCRVLGCKPGTLKVIIKPHIPPPTAAFRSGSSYIGGGHARLEDLGSLAAVLFWIFFLFFSISALVFGAALTDVSIGAIPSATAQADSARNRIADLIMRRS
jgi:hypothetical protein